VLLSAALLWPQTAVTSSTADFIRINSPRIVLAHIDLIDGTGVPVKTDQTIVIDDGRIGAVGPASSAMHPPGAQVLDLRGRTVFPGLVGMHDHLFYAAKGGRAFVRLPRTFARLSLAAGVTTIRTAGAIDLTADRAIKREIDEGREAGPKIHLSSPYLGAAENIGTIERTIEQLADAGVTSLKAYTTIRRAELAAAIRTAHRRGLKVTGHLCAVGFREAAAMGIDNLEHGIIVDSEFYSGKVPDQCPDQSATIGELIRMNVESAPIQQTIRTLVEHGVAVTSTLAVFETLSARTGFFDRRVEPLFTESAWDDYVSEVQWRSSYPSLYASSSDALAFEMAFERSFVRAGGVLMAGADPTGWGGALAGFANQRNVELLVGAGFTPEQAIQIASANGAAFLGEADRIGTIQVGKQADLVVVQGNPAARITDIRNVELVFKDGVGFDPQALTESEHSNIGAESRFPWTAIAIGPVVALLLVAWHYLRRRWRRASAATAL
jgi:imidazolonepropionase-like amidohydrolase